MGKITGFLEIEREDLWTRTVFPASAAESWFISGSAAYWRILDGLDEDPVLRAYRQEFDDLFRSIDEMIGRTNRLEMNDAVDHWKARGIDLSALLVRPDVPHDIRHTECQLIVTDGSGGPLLADLDLGIDDDRMHEIGYA